MSAATTAPTPSLTLIAAVADNGVIGRGNALPWRLPADLAHFKRHTLGKLIVMGRRTWESLPGRLPGRDHLVISRDPDYRADGAEVAHSLDEAVAMAAGRELVVIGGAELYAQALERVDRILLTEVHADVDGDVHFPPLDRREWREAAREERPADANNPHPLSFVTLLRVGPPEINSNQ